MEIFDKNMLDKESLNDSILVKAVVENLTFMDSSADDEKPDFNGFITQNDKHPTKVHTPSPMVARSYFPEHSEPWKNISIYSYSRSGGTEDTNVSDIVNDDVVYHLNSDNILPLTYNWINYTQSYSPELKRDTDIIFEEKTVNDNNEELENSDYSDQSQSPDKSISSNDGSSDSSSDSSPDEAILQETREERLPEITHTYRLSTEPCRDFQEIFNDISTEEFSGNIYHQPPKAVDRDAARRLARRLYECDGFKITDIAKHLAKRNDFSQIVGEEFTNFFDFSDLRLDKALRLFLSRFTLTGETQERERIMHHFSKRYVSCNSGLYNGEDACHTLVCALIILNTNLHSQNQQTMSCNDFILNLKDLNDGDNFSMDNLKELYSAIELDSIRWPMDDELVGIVNMPKQDLMDFSNQMTKPSYSIGLDLPRDSNSKDFMSGYVVRKWLKEPGGRKAAFGKRGWKLFYGRLRDLTVYLYKDHDKSVNQFARNSKSHNLIKLKKSKSVSKKPTKNVKVPNNISLGQASIETTTNTVANTPPDGDNDCSVLNKAANDIIDNSNNVQEFPCHKETLLSPESTATQSSANLVLPPAATEIHINHAYASRALDYVKKKNVFRIKTKYGSEYLFQVNTEKEMDGWIDNINYVAALLSDPEPTIGICTMEKLSARTIPLPRITMLNVRDQLESHQRCVLELEKVVASLKDNTPKKLDKRSRSQLEESIKFREDELLRYKTYCQLLEFELVRMQNVLNIRLSGTDSSSSSSFFCQPFQMTNRHFMNQALSVGPHLLNSDSFINSSFLQSQSSNLRFRPPLLPPNIPMQSASRRQRYRAPVVALTHHMLPSSAPSYIDSSINNQTRASPVEDNGDSKDPVLCAQTTCTTFYEIV